MRMEMEIFLSVVKPQQIGGDNYKLDNFSLSNIKNLNVTEKSVTFELRGNIWEYKIEELKSFSVSYKIEETWYKDHTHYIRKPGEILATLHGNEKGQLDYLGEDWTQPKTISWLKENGYTEI